MSSSDLIFEWLSQRGTNIPKQRYVFQAAAPSTKAHASSSSW